MSIEDIRTLKHAKPFVPFEIVTNDGRTALVSDPHHIAFSPTGRSVSGFGEKARGFYFAVADIAAIRPLESRASGL